MRSILKIRLLSAFLIAYVGTVSAGQDEKYCQIVGLLARGITEDRDRGVSYNAEWRKIKTMAEGEAGEVRLLVLSKSALNTVYLDMPKITPEGAFKLHYVACMAVQ